MGLWSGLDVRRSAVLSGRDTRLSSPVILIPDSDLVNRSSETGHEQAVSVRGGPQDPIHSPARATSASVTTSAEDPLGARWKALVCNVPDAKESGNGLCSDGRAESFRHIVRAWASDGRKRRHAEMSILRLESCGPSKPTTKVQRLESGPQPSPNLRPRVHCRRRSVGRDSGCERDRTGEASHTHLFGLHQPEDGVPQVLKGDGRPVMGGRS